jgi:hypothetical protein
MNEPKKIVTVQNVAGNVNFGESPEYQVSSAINELLNILVDKPFEFKVMKRRPSSETIVKIAHNNLQSKSHVIKQYLDYSSKVEQAYSEINSLVTFGKDTILRSLYDLYYSALDAIEIEHIATDVNTQKVRENSDFIFDFIVQKLRNVVFESNNTPAIKEHIDLGVNVVVAHAFIECVIMENPENDS